MSDQPTADLRVGGMHAEPRPQSSAAVPFFLCLIVLFGITYGGWKWWQVQQDKQRRSEAIPAGMTGPPLTEFVLTERSGEPFHSTDMRGRVWVASYFFTTCAGQCIRLNTTIQLLNSAPELKDVVWVSITCDPDNDSLDALQKYAERWNADPERWLFCRADFDYIKRVAAGMKVYLSYKDHQDYAIVIDKAGKIRGLFDATSQSQTQRMRSLLLECLAEKPPQDLASGAEKPKKKEKSS